MTWGRASYELRLVNYSRQNGILELFVVRPTGSRAYEDSAAGASIHRKWWGHKLCVEIEMLTPTLCQHHYVSRLATIAARQRR